MNKREIRLYPFMEAGRRRYRAECLQPLITGYGDTKDSALVDFYHVAGSFGMSTNSFDWTITNLNQPPEDMTPTPTASQLRM